MLVQPRVTKRALRVPGVDRWGKFSTLRPGGGASTAPNSLLPSSLLYNVSCIKVPNLFHQSTLLGWQEAVNPPTVDEPAGDPAVVRPAEAGEVVAAALRATEQLVGL